MTTFVCVVAISLILFYATLYFYAPLNNAIIFGLSTDYGDVKLSPISECNKKSFVQTFGE